MGISYDWTDFAGYVRTTDAAATAVPGLIWTPADKSAEVYEYAAQAVRENVANPQPYYHERRSLVAWVGGARSIVASATIAELNDAGGGMDLLLNTTGTTQVVIKVTGVAATTLNWYVWGRRRVLVSN